MTSLRIAILLSSGMIALAQSAVADTPMPDRSCPTPPPLFGAGPPPAIAMATSIRPSDTSTSTVIRPDPADQIRCGRQALTALNNIPFAQVTGADGQTRDLLLDLLVPARGGPHPLVVYVTGGGFVSAHKENALNLRTYVAEAGFVVASVQYRLASDGATYRDGIADVKAAIRFLRAHARHYGIDPRRVAVWGESAGGYLATMVGLTNGIKDFDQGAYPRESSAVQAVIDKFGIGDTRNVAEDFNPEMAAMIAPATPIARYVSEGETAFPPASNPLTHISRSAPPFLIFSGSRDRIVSPSQTLHLHDALRAAGAHSTRYVLEGAGHGDLAFVGDPAGGLPWSTRQTMAIIVDFLRHPR